MANANRYLRSAGWALSLALAGTFAFGAAFAQAASPIQVSNAVYQEVQVKAPDGKVTMKLVPAAKVVPGDEVVYEINFANTGKETATDVAINNPVPAQLTFVDTAGAPLATVSVDGGKAYGKLAALTVAGADGQARAAQSADVTHLRWVLAAIPPGSKGKVSFKARVK